MEPISLDAYLFFTGNCREAMEFYHTIFGGELTMQSNSEVPGAGLPGAENNIMHAYLRGGVINLMASDGTRTEPYETSQISLSLGGTDEEKLRGLFDALSEGGTITSPLKKEFWGDTFGTLTDKFGIDWMVNIAQKKEAESVQ